MSLNKRSNSYDCIDSFCFSELGLEKSNFNNDLHNSRIYFIGTYLPTNGVNISLGCPFTLDPDTYAFHFSNSAMVIARLITGVESMASAKFEDNRVIRDYEIEVRSFDDQGVILLEQFKGVIRKSLDDKLRGVNIWNKGYRPKV